MNQQIYDKNSWKNICFGDVVNKVNEKTDPLSSGLYRFIAGEHIQTENLKIISWGKIGEDAMGPAFHMKFKKGHILFVSRRPYLRKVGTPHFDGICANTTFILEPLHDDKLNKHFLAFLMQSESFVQHTIEKQRGSVNPYVNFRDLAEFQFRIPPLEEQQRIADLLYKIENAIEQTEKQEHALLNYKKGLLNNLFQNNGTLGKLIKSEDCKKVKFGDVVKQIKTNVDPKTSGLERFIAGEHMQTDDLKIRNWGIIGEGYIGSAFTRKFTKGQVLYGSRRTYLRKVAVADFDGICANTTFVVESEKEKLSQRLLPYLMHSEGFTQHSVNNSKGSTNPYINWKDIAWFEFMIPKMRLQEKVADLFENIDNAIEQTKHHKTTLIAFKKGLLNELIG